MSSIFPEIVTDGGNQPLSGPIPQNVPSSSSLQRHRHPISLLAFNIIVATLCIVLAAFMLYVFCMCKRFRAAPSGSSTMEENSFHDCAIAWTFSEIENATDGFSNRRLLGKGRYGSVYRAIFPDGQVMAGIPETNL